MPGLTIDDQTNPNSQPHPILRQKVNKSTVISLGIHYLQEMGSDSICKVCISKGGSCCSGCQHLVNGVGCTLRNTSCTAWLCGFLKYVLYEVGCLQEWNEFWSQVPGKDFRVDFTPEHFFIRHSLYVQNMKDLSAALAADLKEISRAHPSIGFIFSLREKIDKNIDQFLFYKDDRVKQTRLRKRITHLAKDFHHFHHALSVHRARAPGLLNI
jgi:hypothetical protein